MSTRTFWKTLFKKWWFPNKIRNLSETFWDFSRKQLRHSFQNINLRVQENILRKFFYRIDGILVVSVLERKTLGCWLKINDKVFKTTTSISRETIRDKIFLKFFTIKSCTSGKIFSTLNKAIRQGLSKLHSACPEEYCEHFSLKKGWFLISFSTLSKIIVDFCQTFTAGFPKLQSTCPEKFFEEKNEKRRFLTSFVLWVKKFGTWANKFRQGLPKVHSARPGELLEKKKNSEKRMVS